MKTASPMLAFVLVGVVFAAYWNSFSGAFQFDDYNVIVDNSAVHSWRNWLADIGGIRPFLKLSYTLNWTSGLGLFGFHLFNVCVHAANTVLVYWLFSRFGKNEDSPLENAGQTLNAAFIAALLFALHPVQTEAVTYVSGRSISLMSLFYLGSLLSYIYGRQSTSRFLLYFVSPLLFVLAVLTKEIALTLPLVLLLWEYRNAHVPTDRSSLLRHQAIHWILLGFALVAFSVHRGYSGLLSTSIKGLDPSTLLQTQTSGIVHLIFQLFRVNSLNIDPDLPWLWSTNSGAIGEALLLLAIVVLALRFWRRRPWLGFGILWFVILLLPTNSLVVRWDVANERQLYLAACGIFFIAGMEIEALRGAWHTHAREIDTVVILLLVALGYFSIMRNDDYRDEIALWEATARMSPHKARPHNNLGYAYAAAGRLEEARDSYLRALQLDPEYRIARDNLAALDMFEPFEH